MPSGGDSHTWQYRSKVRRVTLAFAFAVLLTACGGRNPNHEAVAIQLTTTTIVAGQTVKGWLVVTNPGRSVDLTQAASIHVRSAGERVIHCRPEFAVYLSNAEVRQIIGFRDSCVRAPFVIQSGTTRLPFTMLTTYGGCVPSGGKPPFPNCTPFGPPALPPGSYEAKVEWSEHVPLPIASPLTVTLTP